LGFFQLVRPYKPKRKKQIIVQSTKGILFLMKQDRRRQKNPAETAWGVTSRLKIPEQLRPAASARNGNSRGRSWIICYFLYFCCADFMNAAASSGLIRPFG
jgi:hypothetical protein